jgi:magnesium transporter
MEQESTQSASSTFRRRAIGYNPTRAAHRLTRDEKPVYSVFDFDATSIREASLPDEEACRAFIKTGHTTWLNVDGLIRKDVVALCRHYGVHPLLVEDILSEGQRAKVDEEDGVIFVLLPMLFYNTISGAVEMEQVSIVMGKDFVLSFQEDRRRDVFDPVRERLRAGHIRLRAGGSDYLTYTLLDVIVDSYFNVLEALAARIELIEDRLLQKRPAITIGSISLLRKEVMLLRYAILPVRELVTNFVRSENPLIDPKMKKYFQDVEDHIIQANDYAANHRDLTYNLQDLFLNGNNLRLSEVIKVFTIITTLLAPATVIGGIFGMNFDVIPLQHHAAGFWFLVSLMFIIPAIMVFWFRKKGWF